MQPHEKLREWREKTAQIKQAEAARRAEVTSATWFDWENGTKNPVAHRARKLEELTDGAVTADEFEQVARERDEARAQEREARKASSTGTDDE